MGNKSGSAGTRGRAASPDSARRRGTAPRGARAPVSWAPGHGLDTSEWAAAGRRIGAVGRSIQWLLGDWVSYGNAKFGERYARAWKITGYDTQTLMNMVYVASRFQNSRRRENLSWSHHEAVAALDQAAQDEWLDAAGAHRWSVSDLRMMLRSDRKGADQDEGAATGDGGGMSDGETGSATLEVTCPSCGRPVPIA